ncbi:MAG: hypothetical protein QGF46_06080 [Planctomycetota bacterium]|nr:hypothetical protein [Planctomycetota bacterium]
MKSIATAFLALIVCSCSSRVQTNRYETLSYDLVPQTRSLLIENTNGNVKVTSMAADHKLNIDIDFFARAISEEESQRLLSEMSVVLDYAEGNVAKLIVKGPTDNCGANLTVQLPHSLNLDIRNVNGNVDVVPKAKAVSVRNVNGNVAINCDNKVRAKTTNGNIVVDGNTNDFDLRTSNGNISLNLSDVFNGSGSMTATNGNLRIHSSSLIDAKIMGEVENGDYMIYGPKLYESQGAGLLRLETINGNINVTHVEVAVEVE